MRSNYPILYDQNKVRFACLEDASSILALMKEIYGREFPVELIEWYARCPTGPNQWYAAFDENRPIALYALLPIEVMVESTVVPSYLCNNTGVIQEYQGKGLFQALGEYALNERKRDLVLGVPNSKAAKGHRRIGWKKKGMLHLLSGRMSGAGVSARPVQEVDFSGFTHTESFYVIKDNRYFQWRYSRPPYAYNATVIDNHYVIWKKYGDKIQVLDTNNPRILANFDGVVDVWAFEGTNVWQELKRNDFETILENEFIVFSELAICENLDMTYVCLGDNDVF